MITLEGSYQDGATSRTIAARLSVPGVPGEPLDHATASLQGTDLNLKIPLAELTVNSRVGSMPRRINWGDGASFITPDNEAADALNHRLTGNRRGLLAHKLERNLPLALTALVVVSLALVALMFWGVPQAARDLAGKIPEPVARMAAEQTLTTLDKLYFEKSLLSSQRQQELRTYLRSFDDYAKQIDFRTGGDEIGANALALPAGYVVITDELVELAATDEELLAVYLHEVGHARGHHAEASVLQSSAWLVLLTFITGDINGVSETIFSLPVVIGQLAFSREFEREADDFAVTKLKASGIGVENFASILGRLEQAARLSDVDETKDDDSKEDELDLKPGDSVVEDSGTVESVRPKFLEYLSTHPATEDRIRRIRAG